MRSVANMPWPGEVVSRDPPVHAQLGVVLGRVVQELDRFEELVGTDSAHHRGHAAYVGHA